MIIESVGRATFVPFVVALGLIPAVAYLWLTVGYILLRGTEAEGVVIDFQTQKSGSLEHPRVLSAPVVSFKTATGQEVTFKSRSYFNFSYELGEKVKVAYLADKPEKAVVKEFKLYLLLVVFTFLALLALYASIAIAYELITGQAGNTFPAIKWVAIWTGLMAALVIFLTIHFFADKW